MAGVDIYIYRFLNPRYLLDVKLVASQSRCGSYGKDGEILAMPGIEP
jgi:hypothetical protein